jgi:hypothetical protein
LWAILVDSFEVEVAQEVTQLFPKFRCNPWSDSGDQVWWNFGSFSCCLLGVLAWSSLLGTGG